MKFFAGKTMKISKKELFSRVKDSLMECADVCKAEDGKSVMHRYLRFCPLETEEFRFGISIFRASVCVEHTGGFNGFLLLELPWL